jgi:hypothetical protein
MVLVCHLRAEQREDAVARRLHHVTVVTLSRVDRELERRIDNRARLFGVEISINSVEPVISANSAVTVLRSPSIFSGAGVSATPNLAIIGLPRGGRRRRSERRTTLATEFGSRGVLEPARSAGRSECSATLGYLWMNRGPGRQVADWISRSSRAFMGSERNAMKRMGRFAAAKLKTAEKAELLARWRAGTRCDATALDLFPSLRCKRRLKAIVCEFRNRYRQFESTPLRQSVLPFQHIPENREKSAPPRAALDC